MGSSTIISAAEKRGHKSGAPGRGKHPPYPGLSHTIEMLSVLWDEDGGAIPGAPGQLGVDEKGGPGPRPAVEADPDSGAPQGIRHDASEFPSKHSYIK